VPEKCQKSARKVPEKCQKSARKVPENNLKRDGKETDITDRILALLKKGRAVSRLEMAKQLNISEGSVRYHLRKMKGANLIKREGSDKGGKWIIIKQNNV
jgi:ATP-dependent DNA helicase RecG